MTSHSVGDGTPYAPDQLAAKAEIGAEAFFSVDMRTGTVLDVEEFPEARKPAWKLTVDFGPVIGTLRTSAQVTNYSRDELVGRQIVGAINLGSRRIAGFTSQFLILGALQADGTVQLMAADIPMPNGSTIA